MRSTRDCSTQISGEHYISAAILAEFSELRTSGLPFFGDGETRVGRNALRSNILCTRHNSALSPLDQEGHRALVAIRDGLNHVWRRSLSRKTLHSIISGEALELWAIKTLMGLLKADVARTDGRSTADAFTVDDALVADVLTAGRLPPGCGLYVGQDSDLLHDTIGFAPITHQAGGRVSGLRVSFLGIVLDFLFDPQVAQALALRDDPHFQPSIIDLDGGVRRARIILTRGQNGREPNVLTLRLRRATVSEADAEGLAQRFARREFEQVRPAGTSGRQR
ncbi:MAG: hypothetical protein E7773_11510 [Sphingomonas sp.]|uniref:hypothetical protein n=1 Tax=Sphingomonas sp. TaxID=28214 RepID=UPI0012249021|nr:hypothetical protein [Sphingomonas sp.]THD35081.1 MAG: hypothetical protein E7773_11510 [Sphingomonas sp.]